MSQARLSHSRRRRSFTRRRRAQQWLRRQPLRARIIALFTVGAAIAALTLIVLTYSLTRGSLVDHRQESSREQFFANARQVQASLRSENPDFSVLLESLPSLAGSRSIMWTGQNTWRSPSLTPDALPETLVQTVISSDSTPGTAFNMVYRQDDVALLALGLRLQPDEVSSLSNAAYFEVVPLTEIENTLASLRTILLIGTTLTIIMAGGIGVFASHRVLRPLTDISTAATSIAEGNLRTRVSLSEDPDLAKIARSFNEMAVSMEQRIARDARFSSDVSHELRSPLQTLRSSMEVLMRRRHELSENSAAALDLLAGDVDRFEQLVKDLLDIAQVDEGENGLPLTPVNMARLVRHSVEAFDKGHIQNLSLTVTPDADKALLVGDKRRLAQILDNLLRNAEKYGEGVIQVEMSLTDNDDAGKSHILIAVQDNGPGVTPAERDIVFERFTRGALARKRAAGGGAGLGLALVYEHTRLHGGTTYIENKPDGSRGARFVVQLPLDSRTSANA